MKHGALIALVLSFMMGRAFAQRTDLTGLKICIDPGHGGHSSDDRHVIPDPGIDFWESESNFQKALLLRTMLTDYGATVILTRTSNDTTYGSDDEPSLAARVETANSNNVDWFHSIHSNATAGTNYSTNVTLMLVREKRPGGPASSTGNGLGVPEYQEDVTMSNLMGPLIMAYNRTTATSTWLDWSFYGGVNGGFSLGVLRGLLMPGELSEGSFHDFYPETRRLMNNDHRKMEAYALRNAFLQYYGVPSDQHCIVTGIQTAMNTGSPVNGTTVRLLPNNVVYHGDEYNNGYYLFDMLDAGTYTVRFETKGYVVDSVEVTLSPGEVRFLDRSLTVTGPPLVVASNPGNGDSTVAVSIPIVLSFSRSMDTASVNHSFGVDPPIAGTIAWTSNNTVLVFQPTVPLMGLTTYAIRIDTGAHAASGEGLDGNGDGMAGDPYQLIFGTAYVDLVPPRLLARFPDSSEVISSPLDVVNLVFDEPLKSSSINWNSILVVPLGGSLLGRTFQYWEAHGKGGVNVYVDGGLQSGTGYSVLVRGLSDVAGNSIPSGQIPFWTFSVAPVEVSPLQILDSLTRSTSVWPPPLGADATTGVDSASMTNVSTPGVGLVAPGNGSVNLSFVWAVQNGTNLLHMAAPPAVRAFTWSPQSAVLQCYVNGDGGNARFRFVVRDSVLPGGTGQSDDEVSRWISVDWVGWRRIAWRFANDSVGSWRGNGVLDGVLSFEGFQVSPDPSGSAPRGELGFNELSVVTETVLGVPRSAPVLAARFALEQNYPNPFNPGSTITYSVGRVAHVRLVVYDILGREVAVLVDENKSPGTFTVRFDGSHAASGMYFYQLTAGSFTAVRKMVLVH
jgi:N-acetylmuramoyl-L-alanine amidase